jgi:hypothetical protein
LLVSKIPPRIEKKLTLQAGLAKLETYFVDKEEPSEEDQNESGDLVYKKSLRNLGSVHLFEIEVCKDWKVFEADKKTEERRKLLSIAQLVKNETLNEIVKTQMKK